MIDEELRPLLTGLSERPTVDTGSGPLRIAVIGLGWWTREHALPAIDDATNCAATVAVSGSPSKRASVREEWASIERDLSYDGFRSGEATDAYDAVYVCTPNARHLEFATAAAEHGAHVLCEKPMEVSVDRAERMVAACDDAGVELMVAYRLQTDPAIRRLGAAVEDGFVGEPIQVHAHMSQPLLSFFPDPDQWRLDPDLVGPGASVTDLGIYPINTTRFLLGEDPTEVRAEMTSTSDAFADVPDERAWFELTFDGGVRASCSVSQNAALFGTLSVVGTEGAIDLVPAFFGMDAQQLSVRRNGAAETIRYAPVDQMRAEFERFAGRILAGEPVEPSGEHGVVDVAVVERIYEAATVDGSVSIE